ncbi:MAG: hypothetical protein Q8M86_06810 [Syntrophales bacterium]|nr:hypothetical protein [Syntrophales bacterium]
MDTYDPLFSVAGQGGQRRGGVKKADSFIVTIGCTNNSVLARLLLLKESNGNRETLKRFRKESGANAINEGD